MDKPVPERWEVRIGEDLVVLDLASDRYLCVPGAGGSASSGAAEAWGRDGPAPEAPGLLPPGPDRLRPLEGVALLLSLVDLAVLYPVRGLDGVLSAVARRRRLTRADAEAVHRIARAFQRLAVWLPISRKCLVRSFVLARLLQRCALGCDWVVGVRTWPFAAHCWLQHGDVVLDDRPERLRALTVIRKVAA